MRQTAKRPQTAWIALGAALVLTALIWLYPMSMKTAYMQLDVPSLSDGLPCDFTVHSSEAFEPQYTLPATVQQGSFLVKLDHEYLDVDRVEIHSREAASAITMLTVRGNAIGLADYAAASLGEGVVVFEESGQAILSPEALKTVQEGLRSPWMIRAMLTALVVLVLLVWALGAWLKKRCGTIAMLTVLGVVFGCVFMLFDAFNLGFMGKAIPFMQTAIPNWLPIIALTAVMAVLVIVCLLTKGDSRFAKAVIVGVYAAALVLSVGKMAFYSERVGHTPDESAHIGYVAHLTQTGDIVPRFEDIRLASQESDNGDSLVMKFNKGSMSYLKHPPTYYHIMRLANAIEFQDDSHFTVNITQLRWFSMAFVIAALLMMFYIGFTRLRGEPLVHLVYAAVCTLVPMFAYAASGVNNDSLTLLTVTVFFFGILRYLENKRNVATYLLIVGGIAMTVVTKVTAGIVVAIAAVIVLVAAMIKEKSVKTLLSWQFWVSLPLLALPAAYFGYVFLKYGGFQPNMFSLAPEYARTTGFYVDAVERGSRSFVQYTSYFFEKFMQTWTGISSHIALLKSDGSWLSLQNIALVSIWFVPALYGKRSLRNKSPYALGAVAGCVGVLAAVVMQLFNGFDVYVGRGYLGGFQSRYYLCAIVFFAFGAALALEKLLASLDRDDRHVQWLRQSMKSLAVIFVGLLFYEDILYFLMQFTQYS